MLFGGAGLSRPRYDTWVWDGSLWLPANETAEPIAAANQTTRELTEIAFLHTTLGLAAEQSGGRRTDFVRDPPARPSCGTGMCTWATTR